MSETTQDTLVIDCPKCGRHYVATPDDDLSDITEEIERTGFCCEYCREDNE
jgi:hypothetical protein